VQLRHIMVGIIREDSPGKSAALFAAKDPQKALEEHEAAGKGSKLQALDKIPAYIEAKLDNNMKLMDELELSATPAIFIWMTRGGAATAGGAFVGETGQDHGAKIAPPFTASGAVNQIEASF
jgi:thiol:disulfide interchange protein DsbG